MLDVDVVVGIACLLVFTDTISCRFANRLTRCRSNHHEHILLQLARSLPFLSNGNRVSIVQYQISSGFATQY